MVRFSRNRLVKSAILTQKHHVSGRTTACKWDISKSDARQLQYCDMVFQNLFLNSLLKFHQLNTHTMTVCKLSMTIPVGIDHIYVPRYLAGPYFLLWVYATMGEIRFCYNLNYGARKHISIPLCHIEMMFHLPRMLWLADPISLYQVH